MKSFAWANPTTLHEAVTLLKTPAASDMAAAPRPLAGGQDLLPVMKDYIARPARVVNLKTIPGLKHISGDRASGLKIGALVTLTELLENPVVQKQFPGLAQAAYSIGSPQIRNLGTVGGNLCQRPRCWYFRMEHVICLKKGGAECYAKSGENKYNAIFGGGPSYIVHPSDLAPMLVALDATATVVGPNGQRVVPLEHFFILPADGHLERENVLNNDEIIREIHVPPSPFAAHSTYLKFKERESLDFAMASVAAAVDFSDGTTVREARLVLGGVAPKPWPVPHAASVLAGKPLNAANIDAAANAAVHGATPLQHNAYKVPLVKALVRRALQSLVAKA